MARGGNRGKAGDRPRVGTIVALAWLGTVLGAAALAKIFSIGPIAWLETRYSVWSGQILSANILFLLLILTLPSIWVLFGAIARAEEQDKARKGPPDAARQRRGIQRAAAILFGIAGLFAAVVVYASLRSASLPDGREAATPITLEELARGPAPTHRVAITGVTADRVRASFVQPLKNDSRRWLYRPFHPGVDPGTVTAGALDTALATIFLESDHRGELPPRPIRTETVEGYLIEGGLPAYARIVLERDGARIATPHYLLRDGENGLRDTYFTMLLTGYFFLFACGLIGVVLLAKTASLGPDPEPPTR